MRTPRPGSGWTPSRWARRGRYADYVNSKSWAKRRRRWFQEHWERTHEPAICVVCGTRPVDLHHTDYGRLGDEDYDELVPVCRRHHDRIHEAWEATAHIRRLGRRNATLAIIAEIQKQLRAAEWEPLNGEPANREVFHSGTPEVPAVRRTSRNCTPAAPPGPAPCAQ